MNIPINLYADINLNGINFNYQNDFIFNDIKEGIEIKIKNLLKRH